jgi:signal transduction histidine kinase
MLVAGGLAAVALLWAAFGIVRDPASEGRAAMARVAGDISDAIVAEWNRTDVFTDAPDVHRLAWRPAVDAPLTIATVRDVAALRGAGGETFDGLVSEAQRLEVGVGQPGEALDLVLRAIERAPDDARRAQGRLRAIQLAARTDRRDVVREQWLAVDAEFDASDAIGDVSVLLLAGLSAAPSLDDSERADVFERLLAGWCGGVLVIPEPVDEWHPRRAGAWTSVPPRRGALWSRLAQLGEPSAAPDPRVTADARRRQLAAYTRAFGGRLPDPTEDAGLLAVAPPADLQIDVLGFADSGPSDRAVGLARLQDDGRAELLLTTRDRLARQLSDLADARGVLPDGFAVDGTGAHDELGPVVRGPVPIVEGALDLRLRHADPDGYVSGQTDRARALRAGLVATALLVAVAAALSVRALWRARQLTELRRAFIASVSHELRTPAASILLMAENLQGGIPSEAEGRARYHALIGREALRLRRLVEDVLDFSRLERGEPVRLQREDVVIARFADELQREVGEFVGGAGGTLDVERSCPPDAVSRLDTEAVRRAVLNLAQNAVRHGGGKVALAIRVEAEQLVLAVTDQGDGIASAMRERIFEPFERLGSDDGSDSGTGLGLSIVRGIVAGHGGTVQVTDAPSGTGACFTIRLPLELVAEESK